jgi:CheY-like chemotaxis protein
MDSKKFILLVEDTPDDIELTLRAFRKNNIANMIEVVRDGAKALEYLLGNDDERPLPTLVLLDLKLPKVDGHEVLRRIRADERTRCLPVVILTSSREESDILEAYENGANSYIRKPVDFAAFVEAVQKLGLYWLLLNEPAPRRS